MLPREFPFKTLISALQPGTQQLDWIGVHTVSNFTTYHALPYIKLAYNDNGSHIACQLCLVQCLVMLGSMVHTTHSDHNFS